MYYGKAHIAIEKGQLKKIHQKNKEHENEEVLEDDDEEEYDEQEFYFDEIIDKFLNVIVWWWWRCYYGRNFIEIMYNNVFWFDTNMFTVSRPIRH